MNHQWPISQGEHFWTGWLPNTSREGTKPATQYRMCIHPDCTEVQYRDAPKG